ncbi:MAG: ATP-binding protein [Bacteroidales bacterium]|jgi:signal transduction histidine kinase
MYKLKAGKNIGLFFLILFTLICSAQSDKHTFTNLEDALKNPLEVQTLNLSCKHFKELPVEIEQFSNLEVLYAQNCNLESLDNIDFEKLIKLKVLDLFRNNLKELPSSICSLKNLERLELANNKLTKLPECIGNLDSLTGLFIYENELTELPESIGHLCSIQTIAVNMNKLTKLPESIGNLNSLKQIGLSENKLTKLPESFGNLKNLEGLYIQSNELKELPKSFSNLDLSSINISDNQLKTLPPSSKNKFVKDFSAWNLPIEYLPDMNSVNTKDEKFMRFYNYYKYFVENKKMKVDNASLLLINNELNKKNDNLNNIYLLLNNQILENRKENIKLKDNNDNLYTKSIILKNQISKNRKENIQIKNENKILSNTRLVLIGIALLSIVILIINSISIKRSRRKYKFEKDANEKLKKANKELEENKDELIESKKRAFISDMVMGLAHDLKTPVGNALLLSDTFRNETKFLDRTSSDKEEYVYYNNVLKSSNIIFQEMTKIKDWISGFETITNDQILNERKEINLKEYINQSIQILSFKLKMKNINYLIECNSNIKIETSPGFISQIIQNLTNNAIEHGFEGYKIKDKLIQIRIEQNNDDIVIIYQNNGKLISDDNLKRIFDEYFSTKKEGIKGLGLSYVRKVVEEGLHGSISCQSNETDGVKFVISFKN